MIDYANDYYSLIVFYLCLDPLSCLLDNTMVAEGGEKVSGIANIIEIVSNLIFSIVFGVLWGVTGIALQWRIFRYDRLQCNIDFLPSVYCFSPYGSS